MKKILFFGLFVSLFAISAYSQIAGVTTYYNDDHYGENYLTLDLNASSYADAGFNYPYNPYFYSSYSYDCQNYLGFLRKTATVEASAPAASATGSDEKYVKIMEENIRKVENAKEVQEFLDIASTFERIANVEKDKWLPYYYASYGYTQAAFLSKDLNKIDEYADQGAAHLAKADAISPDNAEIKIISALDLLSRIRVDFMQRGLPNAMGSMKILKKAIKLDPENPRAYAVLASVMFNMPPQIGGSKEKGCQLNQQAYELIEKERAEASGPNIEPRWGYEAITETDKKICNPGKAPAAATSDNGSEEEYYKVMEDNISKFEAAKEVQQFLDAASAFEGIANSEENKWLPYYYASYAYTQAAFTTKDLKKVDEYADQGAALLAKADKLSPDNSEIKVVTALDLLCRIRVDFMNRGMQNSMPAIKYLKKAIELDPENPRAYAVLANVMFNMPPQVGGSQEKGCQLNQQALQFIGKERAEASSPNVEPRWGYEAITDTNEKVCSK